MNNDIFAILYITLTLTLTLTLIFVGLFRCTFVYSYILLKALPKRDHILARQPEHVIFYGGF